MSLLAMLVVAAVVAAQASAKAMYPIGNYGGAMGDHYHGHYSSSGCSVTLCQNPSQAYNPCCIARPVVPPPPPTPLPPPINCPVDPCQYPHPPNNYCCLMRQTTPSAPRPTLPPTKPPYQCPPNPCQYPYPPNNYCCLYDPTAPPVLPTQPPTLPPPQPPYQCPGNPCQYPYPPNNYCCLQRQNARPIPTLPAPSTPFYGISYCPSSMTYSKYCLAISYGSRTFYQPLLQGQLYPGTTTTITTTTTRGTSKPCGRTGSGRCQRDVSEIEENLESKPVVGDSVALVEG